jgi:uncharacterized protein (TIGR03437 family)
VWPACAQVATLGKGWLLDSAGSITSAPSEVISGKNSIKGSFSGPDTGIYQSFLWTNPTFIPFPPNATYTITFSYRILTAGSRGFQFGFFSGNAQSQGVFLPTSIVNGATGASGTAVLTGNLGSYSDIQVGFKVVSTGAIVVDEIQITNSSGQLFASENAEGPTLLPGPLNFQLTDAITLLTAANGKVVSSAAKDLNGDGHPETILTLASLRPTTTPSQPIIIESSARLRLATSDFFPDGPPTVKDCPMILFADINDDGLEDILFAEAGSDAPPWPGSAIGIGLNLGNGKYRNLQPLIPADQQTTRSYAIAAGDVLSDGHTQVVLPDENDGSNTALLRWNVNGFDETRNWVPLSLWRDYPSYLHTQSWMVLSDFDQDGIEDLLVTGQGDNPNFQILFGASGGFTPGSLVVLPDGPWGHTPNPSTAPVVHETGEVSPVIVADFNNDGKPDIFAIEREIYVYQPGVYTDTNDPDYQNIHANGGTVYANSTFQVRINQDSRQFTDVSSGSTLVDLGRRECNNLFAIDINNDGFLDVVGTCQTDFYAGVPPQWGSTVFLNDGTGAFQVVEGTQLLAAVTTTPSNGHQWNLGAFVPTVVSRQRIEGIVYEPVGGPGGCGLTFCPATGLNLYKVVGNGAIGTGPNFTDPASLGAPGFNEFYYLRHYPDAAAAVQAGQYPNGLAHYLAVGEAKGYLPRAPNPLGAPVVTGVVNAAGGQPGVASGAFVSIYGSNFTPLPYDDWSKSIRNGKLPTELDRVRVTIGGKLAPIYAITPGQINVQAPDLGNGPAAVVVTTDFGSSAPFATNSQLYSPAFFPWPGNQPVATHVDYSAAAKSGSFSGLTTVPAKPGDVIALWGTGFGPTNPVVPAGQEPTVAAPATQNPVTVTLGGTPVPVLGAVLSGYAAVYQIAIQIPESMPDGDYPILASVNGVQSPGNVVLSVHQ